MNTEKQSVMMEEDKVLPSFETYKAVVQHVLEVRSLQMTWPFLSFLMLSLVFAFFSHQHGRSSLGKAVLEKRQDVLRELLRLGVEFSSEEVHHVYFFVENDCFPHRRFFIESFFF